MSQKVIISVSITLLFERHFQFINTLCYILVTEVFQDYEDFFFN